MSVAIIKEHLLSYECKTILEQEHALKEIAQEITLSVLSRSEFFKMAAFQGGTCLRILYGLERFSEDLDFVLLQSDSSFIWDPYITQMSEEFNAYGFTLEAVPRKNINNAIKTAFLKADSEGKLLILTDKRNNKPKMRIKLEIDTRPPQGSHYDIKYLDFPLTYSIRTQDLPSLFASKCHALLCREHIKGRDWYDFNWYIARKVSINFELLTNALKQAGSWQNQSQVINTEWLINQLTLKIKQIDWDDTKQDVARFLRKKDLSTLALWSSDFFISRVEKLDHYLKLK